MPSKPFFTKDLFKFLVELRFNNERPWFNANKPRYEALAKKPMAELVQALVKPMSKINPAIVPGSVFRIYRDTRFSKDKTPYKTHIAAQFRHRAESQNVHAPGFYLHFEPGDCQVAAGIWMPDSEPLRLIRKYIEKHPAQWAPFSRQNLWGEALKRPPKGFPKEHRFIEDIKRKHFIVWAPLKDSDAWGPGLVEKVSAAFRRMNPLILFLCRAMKLK